DHDRVVGCGVRHRTRGGSLHATSAGTGRAVTPPALTALRPTPQELAGRAGEIALRHFRRVTPERKADRTLVTLADREVEAYVAAALARLDPAAAIVGGGGTRGAGGGVRSY